MKRRSFLKLAGAAAVPFIIPARVFGQTAPSRRLNVGCIGAGGQWGGHCDYILGNDKLQMTWVCDVDREHVKDNVQKIENRYAQNSNMSSYKGTKTTDDFREVLADKDVDIVWICTPDHWHALTAIGAAEVGKHIYVEKPLARTEEEARAMVNAIQRSGVVAQVGCQQRSGGEFQRAITLIRSGALGKIKSVKVGLPNGGGDRGIKKVVEEPVPETFNYKMWLGPAPFVPYMKRRTHWEWRWNYSYGGGQLTDWINHHYDIAQMALGVSEEAPIAIRNAHADFSPECPLYDTAVRYSFEAHYAGGQVIEVASDERFRGGILFEGENGWIWVNRGRIESSSPSLLNMALPSDGYLMPGGAAGDHRQNFIDAVFNGDVARAPLRHAYYTVTAAHLANAAFRAGIAELKWDPITKKVTNSDDAQRYLAANYHGPWTLSNA